MTSKDAVPSQPTSASSSPAGVITLNPPGMRTAPSYHLVAHTATPAYRLVFTAGQIGAQSDGTVPADPASQIKQAFVNLEKCLSAAGARKQDILKFTFYIVDYDYTNPIQREIVLAWLGEDCRPPTTLVPVTKLARPEFLFEVEAIAAVPLASSELDEAEQGRNKRHKELMDVRRAEERGRQGRFDDARAMCFGAFIGFVVMVFALSKIW